MAHLAADGNTAAGCQQLMSVFHCTVEHCDRTFSLEGLRHRHSQKPHVLCSSCGRAFVAGGGLKTHQRMCSPPPNPCAGHNESILASAPYLHTKAFTLVGAADPDGKQVRRRYHDLYFCGHDCVMLWANSTTAVLHEFASSDASSPRAT